MTSATPPEHDPKLWFKMTSHCGGQHFLVGDAKAGPGRMSAWCPDKGETLTVTKRDMDVASPEAETWIREFLSNNAPAAPADPAAKATWEKAVALFTKTGYWHDGDRTCNLCGSAILPSWTGDECESCYEQHL